MDDDTWSTGDRSKLIEVDDALVPHLIVGHVRVRHTTGVSEVMVNGLSSVHQVIDIDEGDTDAEVAFARAEATLYQCNALLRRKEGRIDRK